MDATNETDATRPESDQRDSTNATAGPLVLSVADAAEALGISAGAVRKRIERGQLVGQKVRGQWQVVFEQLPGDATDATSATRQQHDNTTRQDRSNTTTSVVLQSDADRYVAIVAPFLDRLEAQAELIGRQDEQIRTMAEELAVVTAQRDQLQASAASPQAAGSGASAAEAAAPDAFRWGRSGAHSAILARVVGSMEAASPVGGISSEPSRVVLLPPARFAQRQGEGRIGDHAERDILQVHFPAVQDGGRDGAGGPATGALLNDARQGEGANEREGQQGQAQTRGGWIHRVLLSGREVVGHIGYEENGAGGGSVPALGS
jgi:hypothetical protein